MSCECYKIGGPWITYDPSCPAHGDDAQRKERQREREQEELEERHQRELQERDRKIELLERTGGIFRSTPTLDALSNEFIKWIKVSDVPPKPGMIVKKFKNGAVWAGRYNGTEKESSFVEYIQLPE